MNSKNENETDSEVIEPKLPTRPLPTPVVATNKPTLENSEPEYRVQALLPELLKNYPKHVVHAVLVEHGLTNKSLTTKSQLVSQIEAWLKGAVNG